MSEQRPPQPTRTQQARNEARHQQQLKYSAERRDAQRTLASTSRMFELVLLTPLNGPEITRAIADAVSYVDALRKLGAKE